mgnify:CR=1 FL=1
MSLTGELLRNYEREIEGIKLIPSDGGRFEVTVNGRLLSSKLQTHRHAEAGEVAGLIGRLIKEG